MVSSYTPNKYIEKPANGDYNNTWSTPVNSDWDVIDTAFGGTTTINAVGASGTVALSIAQYRPPIIAITGALTANVNYQLPAGVGGTWAIFNNTSGAFSILFSSAGGGSTVTLPQGYTVSVISDGTNIGLSTTNAALISSSYANPSWITSLAASKLTGSVAVTNGGTGQTTYTDGQLLIGNTTGNTLTKATLTAGTGIAITNSAGGITIAAAAGGGTVTSVGMTVPSFLSVSGSPITTSGTLAVSLSGTALPVANGGTGGTTQATARSGIGAAVSGANTDITSLSPTGTLTLSPTSTLTLSPTTGTIVGAPTGGAQGAGTINATGLFVNGVAVGTNTGTVSSVSVTSGNGFAGTVATATSTPAITISTTITGVLKGNGTAISAATAGTDYVAPGGALGTPSSGTLTNTTGLPISTGVSGLGTGVATALGVNTGSSGAFVTLNGALGTPSSGTLTNCTFPTLNQNTTGNAATATTATTATTAGNVSGVVAIANGGTGNTTAAAALAALGGLGATASALSDPGYITLSNGLTIQWGSYFHAADTYATITFPVSYTTGCYSVVTSGASEAGNVNAQANGSAPNTISTASFQAWNAGSSRTYWYIAIGV